MSNESGRYIPAAIKRDVRQRCGFGCVICGLPLYEYEHMMEFAVVQRHVVDEITLLCDRHRKEKTNGLLPKSMVEAANASPYNLRTGVTKPYDLHFNGDFAVGNVGGNVFVSQLTSYYKALHFISIDGISLMSFASQNGHLLLNVNLFDETGRNVLIIEDNAVILSVDVWDIQLIGRKLTIHQEARKISIDLDFEPPNMVTLNKGVFSLNGVTVRVESDKIIVLPANMSFSANTSIGAGMGIRIGQRIDGLVAAFGIDAPARFPQP